MAPLVKAFQQDKTRFETRVCVSAQHRHMLDQVLQFFDIVPDMDLNLMKPGQNLHSLTADVLTGMRAVFQHYKPDYVLVHGDTTTSMASALAAFYEGIQVCHVEAGLRTYQKWAPFPEEINRQLTGRLADFHFAPTQIPRKNLLSEGVEDARILVSGNTVIDALFMAIDRLKTYQDPEIEGLEKLLIQEAPLVLVTGHRRENFGDGFEQICKALADIARLKPNVQIVYPVHLNPQVQEPVNKLLKGISNIHLIEPLAYPAFVWLMSRAKLIITDSGGIQEEAPALCKPVLVMREVTERPEALESGSVKLVGTNAALIVSETLTLLESDDAVKQMSAGGSPYGDGNASSRIVDFIASR